MKKILQSKALYVVLLVISSMILAATLLIRFVLPGGNANGMNMPGNMPGGFSGGFSGDTSELPSDFDPGNMMPSGDSGEGEAPEMPSGGFGDGEAPEMPSGDSGNMPSGFSGDTSNMPSGFPGNTDLTNFDPASDVTQSVGFLQKVRNNWILISSISFAVMGLCIIRLIMISKRRKKELQEEEEKKYSGLSQDEILKLRAKEDTDRIAENRRQKKTKNAILISIMAVILVFAIVAGKMLSDTGSISINSRVDEEVLSSTAGKSDMEVSLKGSGTIALEASSDVALPGTVEVARWLVSNGDQVEEGEVIAEVDTDSVASAIADLQALISELDSDLELAKEEILSSEITALAGGRVMSIYAAAGDSVVDTVAENGALLILSLDGSLAVDLEQNNDISVGTEVTVTSSDGTEYTGKVAAKDQSGMTVTVSDENTTVGDAVKVTDADGNSLGSGSLYIHSAQKVVGIVGVIDTVEVTEGSAVEADTVLFTLKNSDYSSVTDQLLSKRSTLEAQMRRLVLAYASGYLYASESGVVSGIEDDSEASASAGTTVILTTASGGGSGISLAASIQGPMTAKSLSYTASGKASANVIALTSSPVNCGNNEKSGEETNPEETLPEETNPGEENPSQEAPGETDPSEEQPGETDPSEEQPGETDPSEEQPGETDPSEEQPGETDPSEEQPGEDSPGGDTPGGDVPGGDTPGEDQPMTEEALRSLLIERINTLDYETLMKIYQLLQSSESEETDPSGDNPSGDNPSGDTPSGNFPSGDKGNGNSGNNDFDISNFNNNSGGSQWSYIVPASDTSDDEEEEEETDIDTSKYELSETTLCSITPNKQMSIEIRVDEQDIRCVTLGETVTVALDAFQGRSFEGTVTDIATEGENDGGNTKFAVTVVISSEEKILSGMNASVILPKESRSDVVTIPLKAVCEEGSKVFVYTAYDEESDTLSAPVEIELGLSDGENAEVLSGLSEGDQFFYRYASTITYNFLNRSGK